VVSQKTINFIVIGVGRMGQTHIRAGLECGFNLVGICDVREETLRDVKVTFGIEENATYTRYDDLLAKNNYDLAIIATTAPSHFEIVMALNKSNVKYILCEKPLTTNLKKAKQMVLECKKNGKIFSVNHQMRFMENYQLVKTRQEDHSMGDLRSILISGANIGLAMNATHYFEAFRYLTDSRISKVSAWLDKELKPNPRGPEFFDQTGQIFAANDSGQRIFLDIGADLGHQIICTYNFEFGKITINELNGTVIINSRSKTLRDNPTSMYGLKDFEEVIHLKPSESFRPTVALLKEVVKVADYPSGEDGIHAISVAIAAVESNLSNHNLIQIDELQDAEHEEKWA
jgi:predicted dehydrogenase